MSATISGLVAQAGGWIGEPTGLLLFAVLIVLLTARRDVGAAIAFLAVVAAGLAMLVVLRLASRHALLPFGPYFPSGHAGATTIIIGCVALLHRRLRAGTSMLTYGIAAACVLLVGFGRWLIDAHPVIDIVAGVVVGAATIAVLARALQRRPPRIAQPPHLLALLAGLIACQVAATGFMPRASRIMALF